MIEISLQKANGDPIGMLRFGEPVSDVVSSTNFPLESMRFRKISTVEPVDELMKENSNCVRIRIRGTSMNTSALHEWVALTLDQALVAWVTERWIEKCSLGLVLPTTVDTTASKDLASEEWKVQYTDQLCPGLPALRSIFDKTFTIPHPAFSKVEAYGVIRSSSVSTTTLELLENCVLSPVFADPKLKAPIERARPHLSVIRLSRSEKPTLVRFAWDSSHRKAVVHQVNNDEKQIVDSPIECPEYICFFTLTQFGGKVEKIDSHLRVFQEVMVVDRNSERSTSIELLESIKKTNEAAFYRSFVFVFSVKRNRRSLWMYNCNPQLVKR